MTNFAHLPHEFVKHSQVFLTADGRLLSPKDEDLQVLQMLFRQYGVWFEWELCSASEFSDLWQKHYSDAPETFSSLTESGLLEQELLSAEMDGEVYSGNDDAPVIRLIDRMISEACQLNASDIHIESYRDELVIRFRVDGLLQDLIHTDYRLAAPLISRLKIMASLDIAEKRLPQDGRIVFGHEEGEVDIRLSVLPVKEGERAVLRLLRKNLQLTDLHNFGMSGEMLVYVEELLSRPHGMILVTGPTGSGKSTTLYGFLVKTRTPEKNILTIEDPVEYVIENVGQTQVNIKSGLTFSRGLRALLRQDPDVVMIGEIRDNETAAIAIQSALTGHLVFSTLHTNTAVGAIARLRDMAVEPFLISSVLNGVISQRLVRVLCPECRRPFEAAEKETAFGFITGETLFQAQGCSKCQFRGYRGRTGIYELMRVDDVVRGMIHGCGPESDIVRYLKLEKHGMKSDGMQKARMGVTSPDELYRVINSF